MMPALHHDLKEQILRLQEELDREREETNSFQLEKEEINAISDNKQRELQDIIAELQVLQTDKAKNAQCHQAEIKVFKKRMKHLLCEHQNMITELRASSLVTTEKQQKEQQKIETELHKRMKSIKVDIEKINDECLVKELKLKDAEEMIKLRDELEKQLKETEAVYGEKMALILQELDIMKNNGFIKNEDHWNSHIDGLISDHNKALNEASELGRDLLQVVDGNDLLKTQIKEMKTKLKEKDLTLCLCDNKRLAELLLKAKEEIAEMEAKIKRSGMETNTKEKIAVKKMKDLKRDHEKLKEKFNKLQLERDELNKTHSQSIQKVQHKADLKNMQLETKLKALTDSLEKTNAQLYSVVSAPNMDQTALHEVIKNIKENLDSSNNTIRILQYKKDQISKARKDLLLYCKAKLRAVGVPVEELRLELEKVRHRS
nr:PREDICTED: growth arrest-specific protein 8-like isoform X1 [Paralichthys olivaceus]